MLQQKRPLENYIVVDWLAQQCEVSRGVIHSYALRKKLRYYLFAGIRYLERNDGMPYGSVCLTARSSTYDLRASEIFNPTAT